MNPGTAVEVWGTFSQTDFHDALYVRYQDQSGAWKHGFMSEGGVDELGPGEVFLADALNNNHQKPVNFGGATTLKEKFVNVALSQVGYYQGIYQIGKGTVIFPHIGFDPNVDTGKWTKYGPNAEMDHSYGSDEYDQIYEDTQMADWYAAFVSWCADRAGISRDVFWRDSYARHMQNRNASWAPWSSSTEYFARGVKDPQKGDVIYFFNPIGHVGIVYDLVGDTVQVVEGNGSLKNAGANTGEIGGVYFNEYPKNDSRINGYTRITL